MHLMLYHSTRCLRFISHFNASFQNSITMFYNSSLSYMRACVVFEIVFQSVYKKLTQLFANITPPPAPEQTEQRPTTSC